MSVPYKQLLIEAVALARTGHGVIVTATTLAHLGEVATECRKLMGGKIERGRINDGGGGHIQFVLARKVCTAAFTPRNAAPDNHINVVAMYSPMAALPAGVKSVGELAMKAVAHLTRGPIKGLVIDESDATSHAGQYREPRKTRVRVKRSTKAKAKR